MVRQPWKRIHTVWYLRYHGYQGIFKNQMANWHVTVTSSANATAMKMSLEVFYTDQDHIGNYEYLRRYHTAFWTE